MRLASTAPPGRKRYGRRHTVRSSDTSQPRRDGNICPRGFDKLRENKTDAIKYFDDEQACVRRASPDAKRARSLIRSKRTGDASVCPLEAMGIQGAYICGEIADSIKGCQVIHCVDNKAANAGALRGFSGSKDLARIAGDTRWAWHRLQIDPWVEYVATHANLSDWPSRGEFQWLIEKGAVRVDFNMPSWLE